MSHRDVQEMGAFFAFLICLALFIIGGLFWSTHALVVFGVLTILFLIAICRDEIVAEIRKGKMQ